MLESFPHFNPATTPVPLFFAMQRICRKQDGVDQQHDIGGMAFIEADDHEAVAKRAFDAFREKYHS